MSNSGSKTQKHCLIKATNIIMVPTRIRFLITDGSVGPKSDSAGGGGGGGGGGG